MQIFEYLSAKKVRKQNCFAKAKIFEKLKKGKNVNKKIESIYFVGSGQYIIFSDF